MVAALYLLPALTHRAAAQLPALAWPKVTLESRPWTRWWWLGSAVDSANIGAGLSALAAAGFGGVEVTAIYGVKGAESASVPYLSDRWVQLLRHTVSEAARLGMRVDMPPGSGWRTGGPFVTDADANASLRILEDTLRADRTWTSDFAARHVEAVVAVSDDGHAVEIAHVPVPKSLTWQAPPGRWTIYIAETRFSGDDVKRAAPGGEGRAMDVFSRAAVDHVLRAFDDRLTALPRGALRSYFHDSFEYTGNGSTELFQAFRQRRGYDLASHLPALLGKGEPDTVARVKSDYRQTLDEMLLENFLQPFTAWSHARGSLSRNQAHGSPGNLLDLYAAADIPETEIFGPPAGHEEEVLINKFASSAAHVTGRPLASAESFTWLGEHFSSTLDDVKQAADALFVGGINHLVYHGTAYSPRDTPWPGWQFYAAAEFNPRNAFWRDLPAFDRYVTRVQSVLQAGQPDNDVLLYWPVWDNWHDARGLRMDFKVRPLDWLMPTPVGKLAASLWKTGVGFDYFSDRMLAERLSAAGGRLRSGRAAYRAVVVPATEHMPPETFGRLMELARAGGNVIFLNRMPADVPGLSRLDERRSQLAALERGLVLSAPDGGGVRRAALGRGFVLVGGELSTLLQVANVRRETMVDHSGVRFIRQRTKVGREYFVTHAGRDSLYGWVPLAIPAASVVLMDPLTGRAGVANRRDTPDGATEVYLQIDPGASLVLRTFDRPVVAPAWAYRSASAEPVPLRARWEVSFVDGGPAMPAPFLSDAPRAWTGRGDAEGDRFAGTARYRCNFDAPRGAGAYLLDLGRVAESARVRLNGRDLGVLFSHPFRVETGVLQVSGNTLEVEVTNLSANRIRDLDVRGVSWKIFHDINYVGLDYKPFDASKWPVRPSGLIGPVTLQALTHTAVRAPPSD